MKYPIYIIIAASIGLGAFQAGKEIGEAHICLQEILLPAFDPAEDVLFSNKARVSPTGDGFQSHSRQIRGEVELTTSFEYLSGQSLKKKYGDSVSIQTMKNEIFRGGELIPYEEVEIYAENEEQIFLSYKLPKLSILPQILTIEKVIKGQFGYGLLEYNIIFPETIESSELNELKADGFKFLNRLDLLICIPEPITKDETQQGGHLENPDKPDPRP